MDAELAELFPTGPTAYRLEQQITDGIRQAFAALSNACVIAQLIGLSDAEFENRILEARALLLRGAAQHNQQTGLVPTELRDRLMRSGIIPRMVDPVDALRYLSDVAARLRELRRTNQIKEF